MTWPTSSAPALRTVGALGLAQTLAWASSFYRPAILATPMARALLRGAGNGILTIAKGTLPGAAANFSARVR